MTPAPYAIIDISSHSLRLVIFKDLQRYPLKVLDDNILCRLGELDKEGNLQQDRMEAAISALKRYKTICKTLNIQNIYPIATTTVRDAGNGDSFIKQIKSQCGLTVQIINAEDEAIYAASGVISAFSDPHGLVADLGGSSMELIRLDHGRLCEKISIPVGPLYMSKVPLSHSPLLLDRSFLAATPLFAKKPETLYLVGGSARAFAKAYMEKNKHPIEIIHGYELTYNQAIDALTWLENQTPKDLESFSLRVSRRKNLLPLAARSLKLLVQHAKPERIRFSNFGLREGFAFTLLPKQIQKTDILVASCQEVAKVYEKHSLPVNAICTWAKPVLSTLGFEEDKWQRLLLAIATLSDCGWTAFQDYRPEYAFMKVMHSPWILCTHEERLILALALYYRYDGKEASLKLAAYGTLISEQDHAFARSAGLLLSFYAILFDNLPPTWKLFPYVIKEKIIEVSAPSGLWEADRLTPYEKSFEKVLGLRLQMKIVSS